MADSVTVPRKSSNRAVKSQEGHVRPESAMYRNDAIARLPDMQETYSHATVKADERLPLEPPNTTDKLCSVPCRKCKQPCHNLDVPHHVHSCVNSHLWMAILEQLPTAV
jgi:hypothetical protein